VKGTCGLEDISISSLNLSKGYAKKKIEYFDKCSMVLHGAVFSTKIYHSEEQVLADITTLWILKR